MTADSLRVAVKGTGDGAARVVTLSVSDPLGLAVSVDMSRQGALRLADSLRMAAGAALVVVDGHP
jgi:hypothetical protein